MSYFFKSNLSLIFILFLGFLNYVSANENIGRILKMRGNIEYYRQGKLNKTIKEGSKVFVGDKLTIKGPGFSKVLMNDDTIFQIGSNSSFVFEKFVMETKSNRSATYNLLKGQLRSLFSVKSDKRSLIIKTPNTAMGVRGTEILTSVYLERGQAHTDIALISGSLEVFSISKSRSLERKRFLMKPGEIFETRRAHGDFKGRRPIRLMKKKMLRSLRNNNPKNKVIFLDRAKRVFEKNKSKKLDKSAQETRVRKIEARIRHKKVNLRDTGDRRNLRKKRESFKRGKRRKNRIDIPKPAIKPKPPVPPKPPTGGGDPAGGTTNSSSSN